MIRRSSVFFGFLIGFSLIFQSCEERKNDEIEKKTVEKTFSFDLDQIKKRGKLIALTENSSTNYFIYRGEPMGYEYDILRAFAKDLGVTLEIKLVPHFDSIFNMLNSGQGDIIACNLTVTKERSRLIDFSNPYLETKQVLIQRKPDNWNSLNQSKRITALIKSPTELAGKTVHVRNNTSYYSRLQSLSEEIGSDIDIQELPGEEDTEESIKKVAEGEIDYTIADKNIALLNQAYYTNLNCDVEVSVSQKISWGVRKSSPELLNAVNDWFGDIKNVPFLAISERKYFKKFKQQNIRVKSDFSSFTNGQISVYDSDIKLHSKRYNFDWRFVSSLIFQESRFDPLAKSWAGAYGLMQIMPQVGEQYGITEDTTIEAQIEVGIKLLRKLDNFWVKFIPDTTTRTKFVLASYNAGLGHVIDARKLTTKYGGDQNTWEGNVEKYMKLKSTPEYYKDPIVKHGYVRGSSVAYYVRHIMGRYHEYQLLLPES